MLNFKKEHIIKGGEVEYLVELRLKGYEYSSVCQRFDIDVSCRQNGKRKWNEIKMNRDVKSEIDHLSWDKRYKDADFLSLAEPIKVGHHSEARHRKIIADAQRNTQKFVDELDKADSLREKAEGWRQHVDDINLSMPKSLEYYAEKLAKAEEYHEGLKSGKYPKEHGYSVTYAKKAVNEARKNLELAKRLWG